MDGLCSLQYDRRSLYDIAFQGLATFLDLRLRNTNLLRNIQPRLLNERGQRHGRF